MNKLIGRWERQANEWDAWAAKCDDLETIKHIWIERAATLRACIADLKTERENNATD